MKTFGSFLSLVAPLVLTVGFSAKAQPAQSARTVAFGCNLQKWDAKSPLNEDLNYTRGSGRGYDVTLLAEGGTQARLGDLHFTTADGDQIAVTRKAGDTIAYSLTKARTGVVFHFTVFLKAPVSGRYGSAPAMASSEYAALLTYSANGDSAEKQLATFTCY